MSIPTEEDTARTLAADSEVPEPRITVVVVAAILGTTLDSLIRRSRHITIVIEWHVVDGGNSTT